MLKKKITYTDYNEEVQTEEFMFNISKSELAEMELSATGGLESKINKIIRSNNGADILAMFKEIILMSYGKKSEDGRRFVKSQELIDEFTQTGAYSELFMELIGDEKAAADFVGAIIPAVEPKTVTPKSIG